MNKKEALRELNVLLRDVRTIYCVSKRRYSTWEAPDYEDYLAAFFIVDGQGHTLRNISPHISAIFNGSTEIKFDYDADELEALETNDERKKLKQKLPCFGGTTLLLPEIILSCMAEGWLYNYTEYIVRTLGKLIRQDEDYFLLNKLDESLEGVE